MKAAIISLCLMLFGAGVGVADDPKPLANALWHSVNVRGSYLQPLPGDVAAPPSRYDFPEAEHIRAGSLFGVATARHFNESSNDGTSRTGLTGVFVDAGGNRLMPGPQTSAPPVATNNDVPEDFFIPSMADPAWPIKPRVQVPEGAVAILFSPISGSYADNTNPSNEFGVMIATWTDMYFEGIFQSALRGSQAESIIKHSAHWWGVNYILVGQPEHGTAQVNGPSVVYAPNPEFVGTDRVLVRLVDNHIYSNIIIPVTFQVMNEYCNPETEDCSQIKGPRDRLLTEDLTPNNTSCFYQNCVGEPVNVASGAMWHKEQDFFVPGRTKETGLLLERTYLARPATASGDFGANWTHNWEMKLEVPASPPVLARAPGTKGKINLLGGTRLEDIPYIGVPDATWIEVLPNPPPSPPLPAHATFLDENGGPWHFINTGGNTEGEWTAPRGSTHKLTKFSDRWELLTQDRTLYTFDLSGKLIGKTDRHGETTSLTYDGSGKLATVSATLAGALQITRDGAGRISSVTRARDGLTWNYFYDSQGRLRETRDFAGKSHTYTYTLQGWMTSLTDKLGRTLRFEYDSKGRNVRQVEPDGAERTFFYSGENDPVRVTSAFDIDGTRTIYHFDSSQRTINTIKADGGSIQQTWNPQGFLASRTDEAHNTTHFQYDGNGNLTGVKRPGESSFTLISYDPIWNQPTSYNPLVGATTSYSLSPITGDVMTESRTNGGTTLSLIYSRDSFGNLLSVNNGLASYSHQRNANGLLTQRFDLHNPETIAYDSRFRVATRTFQSGRTISYTYDDYDRVTREDDSHGPDLLTIYDAMGRVLTRAVTDGTTNQTTSYSWDEQDRLLSETDAEGKTTIYKYDSKRVISGPIEVIDPAGHSTKFEYDVLGRRIKKVDAKGAVTRWTYDKRGLVTKLTDANGKITEFEHDSRGRKIRELRPSTQGTSAAKHVLEYTYDDLDRVTQIEHKSWSNGPSRFERFEFDAFDRMVRSTLWNGSTMEEEKTFSFSPQLDADSLLSANSSVVNYSFTKAAVPPFSSTSFSVQAVEGGNPKGLIEDTFTIQRDGTGNISQITGQTTGQVVRRKHDAAGRMTAAKTGNLSAVISFDGFGRKKEINFTNGVKGTFAYDILNRIENISWNNGIEQSLAYNKAGNIAVMDRENGTYNLSYDEVDQLTGSKHKAKRGVENYTRSFGYDLLGNRTADSKVKNQSFQGDFLLENELSSFLADQDGFGQLISETDKKTGRAKNFSYRADGRIKTFQEEARTVNYFYDAFDRKVAEEITDAQGNYKNSILYEGDSNRILLAKNGAGQLFKYLEGQGINEHLGEVGPSGSKAYATDHLGSVLNSEVAGQWNTFGLFGETYANIALSPSTPAVNYGWQGLSYDAATGNWDNRARQYNQNTGTFASQDPIGIKGGETNLYRSRKGNPLRYLDRDGNLSEEFVAGHLTPEEQLLYSDVAMGYGALVTTLGAWGVYSVYGAAPGACTVAAGAGIIYEAKKNKEKAQDRINARVNGSAK